VVDQVLDHRLALDLERVAALAGQLGGEGDGLDVALDGLDRLAGGDAPHDRHLDGAGGARRSKVRDQLEPARHLPRATQVALALQDAEVVIDDRCRGDADRGPDVADAGRKPVLLHELPDESQHLLLAPAQRAHRLTSPTPATLTRGPLPRAPSLARLIELVF